MLDYALLEALLAVEREGSFEGAGRSLGITSSAVSQRIKLLEHRMGGMAVNRQVVPVVPTEFGTSLCRHTERVMLLEKSVVRENKRHFQSYQVSGRSLKILLNEESLSSWFVDVLQAEGKHDDSFMFEIEVVGLDKSLRQLKAGAALAAVTGTKKAAQGFRSTYLGDLVYRATASQEFYDRYFSNGVTLENLQKAPTLRFSSQDNIQKQWLLQIFKSEDELNMHTLPSSRSNLNAFRKHVAWGMTPDVIVDQYIHSGELIELIPGATLHKPLYWHCNLAVYDQMKDLTDKVIEAAKVNLHQERIPDCNELQT
ncbi:MAG: ArgP/LysG family DNA-binding transcriptional regulator [Rhizobiaceae bacterium]